MSRAPGIESPRAEAELESDARWILVQRILASEDFHRASNLRKILSYITRAAILRPEEAPREYEIACDVLGRRADFDPAHDNIVRAQFSHLRRKLDQYFATEGKAEPVVVVIRKGSYLPVFVSRQPAQSASLEASLPAGALSAEHEGEEPPVAPPVAPPRWPRSAKWVTTIAAICVAASLIATSALLYRNRSRSRGDIATPESVAYAARNPFLKFLAAYPGDALVVMPDTSAAMAFLVSGRDYSASDYTRGDFSQRELEGVKDTGARDVLAEAALLRTTSANEAMVAYDFAQALQSAGARAQVRYARDLHVNDLNQSNAILIGGHSSNPWVTLFTDQMNFRFVEDHAKSVYYFENRNPLAGEQSRYKVSYNDTAKDAIGYVDVAFTQNPSHSGYILLITGADAQANEAAARLLIHGRLPAPVSALFQQSDLHYFEILLRGKHMEGESDDSFEVVAFRPEH